MMFIKTTINCIASLHSLEVQTVLSCHLANATEQHASHCVWSTMHIINQYAQKHIRLHTRTVPNHHSFTVFRRNDPLQEKVQKSASVQFMCSSRDPTKFGEEKVTRTMHGVLERKNKGFQTLDTVSQNHCSFPAKNNFSLGW